MSWVPHITVASIIEQDNKFLFVEEYVNDTKVINQPAGHLEEHETLEEGCIRETLEETLYEVKVDYLVGIYQERNHAGSSHKRRQEKEREQKRS